MSLRILFFAIPLIITPLLSLSTPAKAALLNPQAELSAAHNSGLIADRYYGDRDDYRGRGDRDDYRGRGDRDDYRGRGDRDNYRYYGNRDDYRGRGNRDDYRWRRDGYRPGITIRF